MAMCLLRLVMIPQPGEQSATGRSTAATMRAEPARAAAASARTATARSPRSMPIRFALSTTHQQCRTGNRTGNRKFSAKRLHLCCFSQPHEMGLSPAVNSTASRASVLLLNLPSLVRNSSRMAKICRLGKNCRCYGVLALSPFSKRCWRDLAVKLKRSFIPADGWIGRNEFVGFVSRTRLKEGSWLYFKELGRSSRRQN